jgi:hypothetical protein
MFKVLLLAEVISVQPEKFGRRFNWLQKNQTKGFKWKFT